MTRLSVKEEHVLELLGDKEMAGLELIKASEERTRWWSPRRLRRGVVYVLLTRMVDRGLVERRSVYDHYIGTDRHWFRRALPPARLH